MKDKKVNISIDKDARIIHWLEGSSPKPIEDISLSTSGSIEAPLDIVAKMIEHKTATKEDIICEFNVEAGKLMLSIHPTKSNSQFHEGGLSDSKQYKEFFKQTFSSSFEFHSFIRLNRRYFSSPDQLSKVLTSLLNFEAKVNTAIENSKDERSNERKIYNKVVETSVPKNVDIEIPLFVGQDSAIVSCDICFEYRDSKITFWLVSIDSEEIRDSLKEKLIIEEAERAERLDLVHFFS